MTTSPTDWSDSTLSLRFLLYSLNLDLFLEKRSRLGFLRISTWVGVLRLSFISLISIYFKLVCCFNYSRFSFSMQLESSSFFYDLKLFLMISTWIFYLITSTSWICLFIRLKYLISSSGMGEVSSFTNFTYFSGTLKIAMYPNLKNYNKILD